MAPSPTASDLTTLPTPSSITLLLKHHKSTTLLSVAPETTFTEVKSLLLLALKSRNITSINGTPVPDSHSQIELGMLADRRDPSKGWVPLWVREREMEMKDKAGKSSTKKTAGGKKSVVNGSVEGAGLTDGTWVAFRFKAEGNDEEREGVDEEDVGMDEDPGWDVELPKYEDEEL